MESDIPMCILADGFTDNTDSRMSHYNSVLHKKQFEFYIG